MYQCFMLPKRSNFGGQPQSISRQCKRVTKRAIYVVSLTRLHLRQGLSATPHNHSGPKEPCQDSKETQEGCPVYVRTRRWKTEHHQPVSSTVFPVPAVVVECWWSTPQEPLSSPISMESRNCTQLLSAFGEGPICLIVFFFFQGPPNIYSPLLFIALVLITSFLNSHCKSN